MLDVALTDYLEARQNDQTYDIESEEKAKALADTPILTGDPEFDQWELEETSEERVFNTSRGPRGGNPTQHNH